MLHNIRTRFLISNVSGLGMLSYVGKRCESQTIIVDTMHKIFITEQESNMLIINK